MNCKLIIAVVVYNKRLQSIKSLEVFTGFCVGNGAEILIFDNSTDEELKRYNAETAKKLECTYISNNGNIGLSKCYNKAIVYASKYEDYWMMFSDDDTKFSREYLANVANEINTKAHDVICGIIRTKHGFFSPVKSRKFLSKDLEFITEPGEYINICAVNTGLTVRKTILEKTGGFDERLFLDLVDYNFMNVLSKLGLNKIFVVAGEITQDFSGDNNVSLKKQKLRTKIFANDVRNFCRINKLPRIYGELIIIKRILSILKNSY